MTTRKITVSAILTSLVVAAKYALGFIVGVEVVTFLCILYSVFLPFRLSQTIIFAFVMITGIIYGFGTWWLVYFFIFPLEGLFSFAFKRLLNKNQLFFALWCGFWGFSIMFWYYPYDLLLFGPSFAVARFATAVIPNLLGAISNFIAATILFETSKFLFENVFRVDSNDFW
ncbi:hypothetical protein [Mycoplasma sp. ATU-Cv-508]|uniref:hypothetical protein n=1 Tax=Mycoplasma sp. ATU-Cv-508 TaxID=2048001 RepID=UPI000FDEE6E6